MMNNNVEIIGTITKDFTKDEILHIAGNNMYSSFVKSERKSGVYDTIKVVSDQNIMVDKGKRVKIIGRFMSYNNKTDNGNKIILYIFIDTIEETIEEDNNVIILEGFICKKQNVRKTPLGRMIADVVVAVNTTDKHSDYIPCIFWGKNAINMENVDIGEKIKIKGRCQSREYQKVIGSESVSKTAYEVSVLDCDIQ